MIFPSSKVDTALVNILAKRPALDARRLLTLVSQRIGRLTVQGLYHELRKLQAQGIVVKERQRYALSLAWIDELAQFSQSLCADYLAAENSLSILPEAGGSKSWSFSSPVRMDALYVQASLAALRIAPAASMAYEWCPHPWFMLCQLAFEERLRQVLERSGKRLFCVLAGETSLDRAWIRSRKSKVLNYRTGGHSDWEQRTYFTVIRPYLITARVTEEFAASVELLFRRLDAVADADQKSVSRMLNLWGKFSVKIEHSPAKSQRLAGRFERLFS